MAQQKSAHITALENEAAVLQAERLDIDLVTLTKQRDEAKQALASYSASVTHPGIDRQEDVLRIALGQADNALSNAAYRASSLDGRIGNLTGMLSGPARAVKAKRAADETTDLVSAAVQVVETAQATTDRLQQLISEATAIYEGARDAAARDVLAAAKAGHAAPAGAADRTQVDALESALAMAHVELADAQAELASAEKKHAQSLDVLRAAQRDEVRLIYECAIRDFVPFVVQYRKAFGSNSWPDSDLRSHVYRAEGAN